MGLDETKAMFDQIARTLEAAIPEGKEQEYVIGDEASRDKLLALVPEEARQTAFKAAMELSDNDAYACVKRIAARAGVRASMNTPCIAYFSHPFWRDLFFKANQSEDFAAAKKKAASGG